MNLADLQREAHAIAKEYGWWDAPESPPKAPSLGPKAPSYSYLEAIVRYRDPDI